MLGFISCMGRNRLWCRSREWMWLVGESPLFGQDLLAACVLIQYGMINIDL